MVGVWGDAPGTWNWTVIFITDYCKTSNQILSVRIFESHLSSAILKAKGLIHKQNFKSLNTQMNTLLEEPAAQHRGQQKLSKYRFQH